MLLHPRIKMKDYRTLSDWEQAKIDKAISEEIEPKHYSRNGVEWDEPENLMAQIHLGDYCAECWNVFYNCVCGHE
jgi:hypothetical protein